VLQGRGFESAAVNHGIAFGRVRSRELKCGGRITASGGVNVAAPKRLPEVCADAGIIRNHGGVKIPKDIANGICRG
jgi:hypothetical protein